MRLLPQKKWKKILLITFLAIIIILVSLLAYASYAITNDVVTQPVVKNPSAAKTALLLYHPGLSSFAHDVSYAFADGLALSGWRVEIATPSTQAPTDTSKYDLVVFCASVYAGEPDTPTVRQLARMGDLHKVQTVILTASAGTSDSALESMQQQVTSANGEIVKSLSVYSIAPNEGNKSAAEIAKQEGQTIQP